MAHHQSTAEIVVGVVLMGGLGLISLLGISASNRRLEDPTDDRTIYLDELQDKALLAGAGCFRVTIYRQSGNVHACHEVTGSAASAIMVAQSTFRRASIPAVNVRKNSPDQLSFARQYHDHRGRAEGKKVGSADIVRVSSQA